MDKRAQLIQRLDGAREKMQAALDGADVQREVCPNWTIKQVLAHITGWDEVCIPWLRAHAKGESPGTPTARGIDAFNAKSVAAREALSYDQVLQEWESVREGFKVALGEVPSEKFDEPMLSSSHRP